MQPFSGEHQSIALSRITVAIVMHTKAYKLCQIGFYSDSVVWAKDLRSGFAVMLHPGDNTKKTMDIGAAYAWYYRVTAVPLIVLIIFALILATAFYASPIAAFGPIAGLGFVAAIILPVLFMWVVIPINIFISAGLFHIVARCIGEFKGEFRKTLSAVVYSKMPSSIFLFTLIVPAVLVIAPVFALWELIVLLLALSNQQKIKWTVALGVVLITVIIVTAVVSIVTTALAIATAGAANSLVNALIPHLVGNNGYTTPLTYPVQ